MASVWMAAATAAWFGVLTSISPCPLASNIAAISLLGRQVGRPGYVLASGLMYALGRSLAYVGLAAVVVAGLMAMGDVSRFLQRYMNLALGPLLIVVGMVLLGMVGQGWGWQVGTEKAQARAGRAGLLGALGLGVLFALSFCPVSAGLYFGGLIPLSARQESVVLLPGLFGLGSAAPVLAFAVLLAYAGQWVGRAFDCLQSVEKWARTVTGIVLIVAGFYSCLRDIYGLL